MLRPNGNLLPMLSLLVLLSEAAKLEISNKPAEVKLIESDSEVFKGEGIHVQCLVTYHDPELLDEITVEFTRSLTNTTSKSAAAIDHEENLSKNGHVMVQAPKGQRYAAYVVNSGQNAKEHAFLIENIGIHTDSGVYKCEVKHNDKLVDTKQVKINVVTDQVILTTLPTTRSMNNFQSERRTTTDIRQNQDLTCHHERVLQQSLKNSKRGGEAADLSLLDIEDPVVCYPRPTRNPVISKKVGESASLPCRAEAMPTPKITWYKETHHGLVQIHANNKASIVIDEFGDFFLQVTLDINQVNREDFGNYICSAKNQHGQDSMKLALLEQVDREKGGSAVTAKSTGILVLAFLNLLHFLA